MINNVRYYITKNTVPYDNLALEEYLLLNVQPGQCILYLWQNRNTVVIGRNQNPWTECRIRELEETGGFLARRLSGGGAVYHDLGNLNFTFLVRHSDYDVDRQLGVIQQAVRGFGLDAQKTGRNDVTVDGRKFSGNAFYRSGDFCYHHGTLLLNVDTAKMSHYLQVSKAKLEAKGVPSVRARVVNLKELNPKITVDRLTRQLLESFGKIYGLIPQPIEDAELDWTAIANRSAFFASPDWKLGASASFRDQAEARFSWGGVTLCYEVKNGSIAGLQLFSDCMDGEFLAWLPNAFLGCPFTATALEQRMNQIPTETGLQQSVVCDCIGLLKSQIE